MSGLITGASGDLHIAHLLPLLRRIMLEGVPPLDMDIGEKQDEARELGCGVSSNVFKPFTSA